MTGSSERNALRTVKIAHTLVWAFFAGSIFAIPAFSFRQEHQIALGFIGIVSIEVLILAFNRMSCPLTSIAARYTNDRRANFDIYLPEWLARHNKTIFGSLYAVGILIAIVRWSKGGP
jgi:hypothetical protein